MENIFYFKQGNRLKEQGKIKEALQAYQKSIDVTSNKVTLDAAKYIRKAINKATSIATINQPPYKKIIFHAGIGGLCNRLRALCNSFCLSYFWDIPLLMCWYPEEACDCYFHDLFEPVSGTISPQSILRSLDSEDSVHTLYVDVSMDAYKTYLKEELDYDTYRGQYLEFVGKIKPKHHVIQELEDFQQQYWTDNIIGLHIRRTDLYPHLKSRNLESEFSSDEKFIRAIEQCIANGWEKFFLATDNQITKNLIYNKFRDRIISYNQSFNLEKKRQTTVKQALIDLYLLAKCQKIIGSYYSSFSEYAASLGNIPLTYP